jgi:hypothetical protein
MIAVGMTMFKDQAASTNRDSISNDLLHLAVQAQKYYRKPTMLGGGGHSYNGLTMVLIAKKSSNANAGYVLSPDPASSGDAFVTLTGSGTHTGNDGANPVQVRVTVWSDSTYLETLN